MAEERKAGALNGKVALVTGGGSGLGKAVVARYVKEGARVGVLEKHAERAAELRREFSSGDLCVTVGDVRSGADNARAVDEVRERFDRLDVFVGNAGVYDNRARFGELTPDALSGAFDELFAVDVKGYLLGARAALDELRRTRGCIVFTASVSGVMPGLGGALYVAAKHAIVGLTRQLAWELAPEVRVNAVAPGYVPTHFRGLESLRQGPTTTAPSVRQLPLQQLPSANDYAAFYVLLASDEGSRTATGMVLVADGGFSLFGSPRPEHGG